MRQKTDIFWDIFKIHLFLLDFQGSKQSLAAPELPLCAGTQVTEPEQTHCFPSRGWGSAITYCWCQFCGGLLPRDSFQQELTPLETSPLKQTGLIPLSSRKALLWLKPCGRALISRPGSTQARQ